MTDQTNKDLPPLPEAINTTSSGKGSWGMRTYGLLFTAKQMRAYARAALSANAPAAGSVPSDVDIEAIWMSLYQEDSLPFALKFARALLAQYGSPAIPDVLLDGYAVLQALDEKAKGRTSAENVSDVLDAAVRVLRARASAPQEGK